MTRFFTSIAARYLSRRAKRAAATRAKNAQVHRNSVTNAMREHFGMKGRL